MVKAIIFDWGGVISAEAFWNWLRKNISDLEQRKEHFQNLIDKENKGAMASGELMALLAKESNQTPFQVEDGLRKERTINEEMVALIRSLKKDYKIGLLSNASSFLRQVIAENNVEDLFDECLISSEHGVIKPEPAIFHKMLSMLDVEAGESVFVDDRQKNVDAANALGIHALLFTDTRRFTEDLEKLGIRT